MRGFPAWINTREDLENVRQDFPDEWRAYCEQLLTDRFVWSLVDRSFDAEAFAGRVENETHKITSQTLPPDPMTGEPSPTEYLYWELIEDPCSRLCQLGLTVAEVEAMLANGG